MSESEIDGLSREQAIRERAYHLWEADGRPDGNETIYWDRARAQLDEEYGSKLETPPPPIMEPEVPPAMETEATPRDAAPAASPTDARHKTETVASRAKPAPARAAAG